jgi:hypothetical protein
MNMISMGSKAMLAAFAVFSLCGEAQAAGECSNATLRGAYGFSVHGELLGLLDANNQLQPFPTPTIIDGVALQRFDGAGHFARTDFLNVNGVPRGGQTEFNPNQNGTYTLNSDCTGSMHLVYNNGTVLDARIVVADDGKVVKGIISAETIPPTGQKVGDATCSPNCGLGVQVSLDGRKVGER